jgi:hypothetical protein
VPNPQPTTPEWTMLGGAVVIFIGSFLDVSPGASAWSNTFTTIKLVPIYAIVVGGVVIISRVMRAELPERVGSFSWPQLLVTVSVFATVMAIAWYVAIDTRRAGIYVIVAGTIVMLIGAIADQRASNRRLHLYSPPIAHREQLSTANLVILGAAIAMLVGSFLPFWKISGGGLFPDLSFNAWNRSMGFLFPVTIIPVLCAAVMAIYVVVRAALNMPLPARVFSFTWDQILLACGFQAVVMMLGFIVENQRGIDLGTGFYLMLAASVALAVGAVLRTREISSRY